MADLSTHFNYVVPRSGFQRHPQQQLLHQFAVLVQCPNCNFCFHVAGFNNCPQQHHYAQQITYVPRFPCGVSYSQQATYQQHFQPFLQHSCAQNSIQSVETQSVVSSCQFSINQPHLDSVEKTHWLYDTPSNVQEDMFNRIRDILIDILNSGIAQFGVTINELMALLEQSCSKFNLTVPLPLRSNFKAFLRYRMTDYIEIQDDMYRFRRWRPSIRELNVSTEAISESNMLSVSEIPYLSHSSNQVTADFDKSSTLSSRSTGIEKQKEQFNKSEIKEHENAMIDKMNVAVVNDRFGECGDTFDGHNDTHEKEEVLKMKKVNDFIWNCETFFSGDVKELIRYLRMVDDYFQYKNGEFTFSEFKEVFGEANQRWQFRDLIEMEAINIVDGADLNEKSVLVVNPIIREVRFIDMLKLAKNLYNLVSNLSQLWKSVKLELIARTVDFDINSRKTMDEKYALLWELLSDSPYRDIFLINVIKRQYNGPGFDVVVQLNPDYDVSEVFQE